MADLKERQHPFLGAFWEMKVGLASLTLGSLVAAVSLTLSPQASAQQYGMVHQVLDAPAPSAAELVDLRPAGRETGLPIPRFVSFKNDKTNMRVGPGTEFEIRVIYNRAGMPVQIMAESGHWRQVRDWEGTVGWVHKDLLSAQRMARLTAEQSSFHRHADTQASVIAQAAAGVLAQIKGCRGEWCILEVEGITGWVARDNMYGTFSHEDFS